MKKVKQYSAKGNNLKDVQLPAGFEVRVNEPLLTQACRVYEQNLHSGVSRVKTRSEVSLSRRKIYRQKGTGGARHGAKSAPIFVGGGIAHGPKGIARKLSLPRNMKLLALKSALAQQLENKALFLISDIKSLRSTKEAALLVKMIMKDNNFPINNNKLLIVLSPSNFENRKFFRNLANVDVVMWKDLNTYIIINSSCMFVDSLVFEKLTKSSSKKASGNIKKESKKRETKNSKKKSSK